MKTSLSSAALCGVVGALLAYAIQGTGVSRIFAAVLSLGLAYLFAVIVALVHGLLWIGRTAELEMGVAALTFSLDREFLLFDATLLLAALGYGLALAIPPSLGWGARLPLTVAGGVCGFVAIVLRIHRFRRGDASPKV